MNGAAAVLDIGKTNVKVATFARDGALLWERAMPNRVLPGPPYPHADVEKIWDFLIAALAEANRAHPISTIVATTHACTFGLIDDKGLSSHFWMLRDRGPRCWRVRRKIDQKIDGRRRAR